MNSPVMMGIINVTPDSFSGDGVWDSADPTVCAFSRAEQMILNGADILDIGGESSRPGSTPVSAEEETRRVVPVILAIRKAFPNVRISIDTVKASVAEAALDAGATIVNDISALKEAPLMGEVVARRSASVVLMHNTASANAVSRNDKLGASYDAPSSTNGIDGVIRDLQERVAYAQSQGIEKAKIILDPGIGFGKTREENLALIARLSEIKALGFPVLIGPSRKSFIGQTLDAPIDDRLAGTAACVAISVLEGADIVRVHDVEFMAQVIKMAKALRSAKN